MGILLKIYFDLITPDSILLINKAVRGIYFAIIYTPEGRLSFLLNTKDIPRLYCLVEVFLS